MASHVLEVHLYTVEIQSAKIKGISCPQKRCVALGYMVLGNRTMLVNEKSKGSSKARGFEVFYSSFPNLGKKIKLLFVGFFPP